MPDKDDASVKQLQKNYIGQAIQQYHGNLVAILHAIDQGWLPKENDADCEVPLESLRQHLLAKEIFDVDSTLLRYGLTVPGTMRGKVPPILVLDENRGGYGPRRQQESAGQITRLREVLTLGKAFIPDLSNGIESSLRTVADLASQVNHVTDEEKFSDFSRLTRNEVQFLGEYAVGFPPFTISKPKSFAHAVTSKIPVIFFVACRLRRTSVTNYRRFRTMRAATGEIGEGLSKSLNAIRTFPFAS